MNYQTPSYLVPFVLSGTVAVFAAVLLGVQRAVKQAGWPANERRQAVGGVAVLLAAWCLAAVYLTWSGFYRGTSDRLPTIQYGVLIPIVVGVALYWKWGAVRRVIEAVPQEWIVGVQLYRALGVIFLVLYAGGLLPGFFALPAGAGDVAVGLLAPAVGIAYAHRSRNAAGLVRAWNLLGIGDLIVALGTGFLTSASRFQMVAFDAPNNLISAFPLALIPVYLVPLSILLHLASLKKLQDEARNLSATR